MTDNKIYQTPPVSSKVAKVAASISLLKNHIKQSKKQNKFSEVTQEANVIFNDSLLKSETQLKDTSQKQVEPIIPSYQNYPIKSLGQRPIIRFIQKSKQIMKINQLYRQKQSIELSDLLTFKVENHQQRQSNISLEFDEAQKKANKIDDKNQFNVNSPTHNRYNLKTEGSYRQQNSFSVKKNLIPEDWGYSVKTDYDETQTNEQQQLDQSTFQRPIKSSSGKINSQNSHSFKSPDNYQLHEDKSDILISEWKYDSKQDEKMYLSGKKIDQAQNLENAQSLQKNNYFSQDNCTITKQNAQFGNQQNSQYSIRTRSCEFRTNKSNKNKYISLSNAHHSSQNYNYSLSNLTFNEIDQSQAQEELQQQQEKLKSNKIFKIILNQIHKTNLNDKSQSKFPHSQEEISLERLNSYKENEQKLQINQDGSFFKQIKNSQKILSKLQNKSSDSINQLKQLQDIQVQGQSLKHRLGEVNLEKIIRTLKQQKKQGNQFLILKGNNFSPQKQEQSVQQQNSGFQCWKDFSEPNFSCNQFIHINSLNKNPKAQVREVEVQKIYQNQQCSSKRQCNCKHNCIREEVQQEQHLNDQQKTISVGKDSEKSQNNETQNLVLKSSVVNLNPNSNHINFRRPARKDILTKQIQKESYSKENIANDDDKQCSGWDSNSAFNQTAESAFLEFVQANLKKRQNIINLIKNGK
ncbi:hypothetical protein TTHERM_00622980 (macronuclear) [Tetrahymena thermophila SB210]|uniref:Uncharacterized protein n=1 Tax=Tetrahymena thermophila (strain SB210) TaxID=312017 RepID=Q240Y6_TETTS|nr:hypothetical protein TTHERM_00622980 [Tetrahymena thermophila SB210]EAS02278.1 hypothetical protein TTHERM_00622980 [Tetrahymena thermophila SB210]|eukprot:XP_001022523.1 hypothetical protein TTHERM_00622980 [Tetrahymena thermophila SB210]